MSTALANVKARLENDANSISPPMRDESLVLHRQRSFELTAAELKAVAESNKDHPHSPIFINAVADLTPDQKVVVDKTDLEALLENRVVDIVYSASVENGRRMPTREKVLGETYKKPTKAELKEQEGNKTEAELLNGPKPAPSPEPDLPHNPTRKK